MTDPEPIDTNDKEYLEAQKRVRKIKKFYKDLASWAGTSVVLLAMNFFLSGGITWAKYPVFFWGIFVLGEVFNIIRLQRIDKEWEERQMKKFLGQNRALPNATNPEIRKKEGQDSLEDYSEDLLNQPDREMADLSEYRKLKRPWKEDDLV